jgi:Cu2+-containing amine oxidase
MPFISNLARSTIVLSTIAIAALTLASLTAIEVFAFKSPPIVPQRVQPLDPLTAEEIELAKQVASADQRVKAALGTGRQRLIDVEFFAMKPADTSGDPERLQMGRHARVLFYRYDTDQGIDAVVDLQRKAVVSVTRIQGAAVPLGADEISDAFSIAIKNDRVRTLLGARLKEFRVANLAQGERPETRVEGLRVLATSPRDPCFRSRCIHLLFRDRGGYLTGTRVTVNLTAQTTRVERTTP